MKKTLCFPTDDEKEFQTELNIPNQKILEEFTRYGYNILVLNNSYHGNTGELKRKNSGKTYFCEFDDKLFYLFDTTKYPEKLAMDNWNDIKEYEFNQYLNTSFPDSNKEEQ